MSNQPNNTELKDGLSKLKRYFAKVIDLKEGVNKRSVIEEISLKKSMSGANSWMLMCSIVIASIGLDIDSPVIIIGAMLISPLMSPILGIGLGVAINDKEMLKDSLFQFGIALAIAIVTSTIYFTISPFGELTEQIRLRTEPTFLDIPIAFFGGIAGIVSIARKDISTALPGVAIATALMPPLCVVGFGLSPSGEFATAASSFYLFFLNTFFVSLATYMIVRYLNFPYRQYVDAAEKKKNVRYVYLISILVMIPSLFIFSKVYKRFNTNLNLKQFVTQYVGENEIYLDDYQLIKTDEGDQLVLKVYGNKISKAAIPIYESGLKTLGLDDVSVKIISTADINLDRFKSLENQVAGVDDIKSKLQAVLDQQALEKELEMNLGSLPIFMAQDDEEQSKSMAELRAAFPSLNTISLLHGISVDSSSQVSDDYFAIVNWLDNENVETENDKLSNYLKVKYELNQVKMINN